MSKLTDFIIHPSQRDRKEWPAFREKPSESSRSVPVCQWSRSYPTREWLYSHHRPPSEFSFVTFDCEQPANEARFARLIQKPSRTGGTAFAIPNMHRPLLCGEQQAIH